MRLPFPEEANQQRVLAVLHVGRDLHEAHFWAVVVGRIATHVFFAAPLTVDRVNREAHVVFVLPPPPAEVHPADLRGRCVAEFQQRLSLATHLGLRHFHHTVVLGEFVGGDQLVAEALALFVVGGDPISSPRGDLLDLIQLRDPNGFALGMQLQRCAAVATQF